MKKFAKILATDNGWMVKPQGGERRVFRSRDDAMQFCRQWGMTVQTVFDARETVRSHWTRGAQEARLFHGREFRVKSRFEPKEAPPAGRWSEK